MEKQQTKICTKCNDEKVLTEFYPKLRGKLGKSSECKTCFKTRIPFSRLKKKGIEPLNCEKEFIKELKSQKYKCKICESKFSETLKPCIDHDHKTNLVRGILCSKCNKGLGFFEDNVSTLLNAIVYLKTPKSEALQYSEQRGKLRRKLLDL